MKYSYSYRRHKLEKKFKKEVDEFVKMLGDRQIRILLFWAIIGPLTALAYIIWIEYPKFRWLSVLLAFMNMIYFIGQFGGWMFILARLFGQFN